MAPGCTKVILLIGRTGQGKSTVGNVLSGKPELFKEGEFGVSETKNHQSETIECDGELQLKIVDTIGIGDTQLPAQEVLYKIADACYTLRDGLHQILFITGGKFTEEEMLAYDLLRSVIFNKEIVRFITIVRSRFPSFRNPDKCSEDIERMKSENNNLGNLISTCNKVIHVNNLTEEEEPALTARNDSRMRLLAHLRGCSTMYRPIELDQLNARIANFMTEKERLQNELADTNRKLAEKDALTRELQESLQREKDLHEQRINALKEQVSRQTGMVVREKGPEIFELVYSVARPFRKCSIQ